MQGFLCTALHSCLASIRGRIACMVQLTPEQARELEKEQPPRIVAQGQEYVLIRADVYDRVKEVLEEPEEIDPSLYEAEDLG